MSRLNRSKNSKPAPRERSTANATPARGSARSSRGSTAVKSGDDIFYAFERDAEEASERERKREAGVLYVKRFWLKPGEERDIIFLDEALEKGRAFWEHNLEIGGKFGNYEMCTKELGAGQCPICKQSGPSYLVLNVSILDTTGYESRKRGHVDQEKVLLCLRRTQFEQFKKVAEDAIEQHGTLRGVKIRLARGKDAKSARIGEPVMIGRNKMYEFLTEKELDRLHGHDAVKGADKKIIRPENFDITPFDYDTMFPEPDPEEVRKRFGGEAHAGSRAEQREVWGDDAPQDDDAEQPKGRARRSRGDDKDADRRGAGRAERSRERVRNNAAAEKDDPLARPAASRRRR